AFLAAAFFTGAFAAVAAFAAAGLAETDGAFAAAIGMDLGLPRRASRISVKRTSSFVGAGGSAGGAAACLFLTVLMPLTTRNKTKATMVNFTTALMNKPILSVAMPASFAAAREETATLFGLFRMMNRFEKSTLPRISPISGMKTSSTRDETMVTNAAPIMTPIARSMTLPLMAKSRNSLSMDMGTPLRLVHSLGVAAPRDNALQINRFALTTESCRSRRNAMVRLGLNLQAAPPQRTVPAAAGQRCSRMAT